MSKKKVVITLEEYNGLLKTSHKMDALVFGGVDNWSHYSDIIASFEEDWGEFEPVEQDAESLHILRMAALMESLDVAEDTGNLYWDNAKRYWEENYSHLGEFPR